MGPPQPEALSEKLLELYKKQNLGLQRDIRKLETSRAANSEANRLFSMLGMVPETDSTDKVLKYERGLQKSIYQNLIMLKKLRNYSGPACGAAWVKFLLPAESVF